MLSKETSILIKQLGSNIVADLIFKLKSMDAHASGKLQSSLNYKVQAGLTELSLLIYSEQYIGAIDSGRKAGKQPPFKDIIAWAKLKNIPEGVAYFIAKKIGKADIEPRPFIKDVVNKNITTDTLSKIGKAYAKDTELQLKAIIDSLK
jgi:hypothetical protein